MTMVRGKSLKAMCSDVSEGYVAVNPIFLKSFPQEALRDFYHEIQKLQQEIRADKFPANDIAAIRLRNLRLQRLHSATMIIRNFARERRIMLIV